MEYLSAFWDNHSSNGGYAKLRLGWNLSSIKNISKGEKVPAWALLSPLSINSKYARPETVHCPNANIFVKVT